MFGCTCPFISNLKSQSCNFIELSQTQISKLTKEALENIEHAVYEYDCLNPCSTMSFTFGFPVFADHFDENIGEAKFYFKSQITVRSNVLVYEETQLLAEIGGYIGLILGFSLLDLGKFLQSAYERFQECLDPQIVDQSNVHQV